MESLDGGCNFRPFFDYNQFASQNPQVVTP